MGSEFDGALTMYKDALTEYKLTGNEGKRQVSESLKAWLDAKIQSMQTEATATAKTVQKFMKDYESSGSDIEGVRKKFKEVRDRGPVLQNVYDTDKKALEASEVTDYSPFYIRAGLIAGLAVVAFVASRD